MNFAAGVQFYRSYSWYISSTVDSLCAIMKNKTLGSILNRLSSVNSLVLSLSGKKCLDYKYNRLIENLLDVKPKEDDLITRK